MSEPKRVAICPECKKEIELRKDIFAHHTISRHMKAEHK
jgi:hypothetical protein